MLNTAKNYNLSFCFVVAILNFKCATRWSGSELIMRGQMVLCLEPRNIRKRSVGRNLYIFDKGCNFKLSWSCVSASWGTRK